MPPGWLSKPSLPKPGIMPYLKSECISLKISLSVFILLFFTCTSSIHAQMRELYRTANYEEIVSYSFATAAEGYVTLHKGDEQTLARTSDSGRTFIPVSLTWTNTFRNNFALDTTARINSVDITALSDSEILLVTSIGNLSVLLSSSNKGQTFKAVFTASKSGLSQIHLIPGTDTVVMLVGRSSFISPDRGQTWKQGMAFDEGYSIGRLIAFSGTCMFVANDRLGGTPVLFKTMDSTTYKRMPIPEEWNHAEFSMISPSKGWAFAFGTVNNVYHRDLYATTDSGYTWIKVLNKGEPIDSIFAITMINDTLGFGSGVSSKLYKTTDGGSTWLRLSRTSSFKDIGMDYYGDFKTIGNEYVWVARRLMLEMGNNGGGPAMRECFANGFSPAKARAGDTIIVTGDNFSVIDSVTLGGTKAGAWEVINKNTLRVIAGSGSSGNLTVYTPVNTVSLEGYSAIPTFSDLFPKSGTTNTHLTLEGTSFTSVTQVKVGDVPAKVFKVLDNNKIQISIPYTTNGAIQLVSPDTIINTNLFYYYRGPAISGISPLDGPAGTTVTIAGSGFSATPDSNVVYFGGIRGDVISSTPTDIKVKVPKGAPYANISVSTRSLTATSSYAFSVTFPDGGSINPTSFSSPLSFDAGGKLIHPGKTAVADFDGDGKPDLITPDWGANYVVISRNNSSNGKISFTDHLKITVGEPSANGLLKAVPVDVNSDGKIDFCIGNNADLSTYIYINTSTPGNISFRATPSIPGLLLEAADVNQDGRPDLIQRIGFDAVIRTNYSEPGSLSFESYTAKMYDYADTTRWNMSATTLFGRALPTLILYLGDESSNMSYNYSLPDSLIIKNIYDTYFYGDFIAGDYNKDGLLDVGISKGLAISILSSTRNQELNETYVADISAKAQIALQDMDGDGKADLMHGQKGVKKLYIYHNTWGEGANDFATAAVLKLNNPAGVFTIADLDGDNKNDFILQDTVANKLLFYQNICSPQPYIDNCLPVLGITGDTITLKGANLSGVSALMLGDQPAESFKVIDESTITFVVGNSFTGDMQVTNSSGTGSYSGFSFGRAPVIHHISPAMGPVGTEVTITGQYFSPNAGENIVNFSGVAAKVISASSTALKVIVPAYTSTGSITVTTKGRLGEYSDFFKVTFPGPKAGFSTSTFDMNVRLYGRHGGVLMDMDNDGKQDIVTHDYDNLIIYHNNSTPGKILFDTPFVVAIKGTGQLNPLRDTVFGGIQIGLKTPLSNPAVMDLNGDGKADIAIFNPENNLLYVYLNNSTAGGFQFLSPYTVSSPGATVISIHDYDGDGKPDILHTAENGITAFRNTGTANAFSLDEPFWLRTYPNPRAKTLTFSDIDKDSKIDIHAGYYTYFNTSIAGRLGYQLSIALPVNNGVTTLYDLNNDIKPDLAIVEGENIGQLTMPLYFYKNTYAPPTPAYLQAFTYNSSQTVDHWVNQIAAGDFDGDGLADLLVNHSTYGGHGNLLKNVSTTDSIRFLPFVPTRVGADGSGWAAAGDLDGDSKPDLVLFGNNDCGTWVARNRYDEVVNITVCNGTDTSITSNISGNKYQWQVLKTGADFTNISDDTLYANATGKTLQLKHVTTSINGYTYRCLVDNNPGEYTGIQVTANTFPTLNLQRVNYSEPLCPGTPIALQATAYSAGAAPVFQWWMDDSVRLDSTGTYFECDTFTVNHSIQVKMISNGVCPDKSIVESTKEDYTVINPVMPQVKLTASSSVTCNNDNDAIYTFTANTLNIESYNSPSYKWYYNGAWITDETGPVFTKSGLQAGDSIYATLSVAFGDCITDRDYRSNTVVMTKGNPTAAIGRIMSRSYSNCPTDPKTIIFTSTTADTGSKVEFYETNETGQFYLRASVPFKGDSVVYPAKSIFSNSIQQYFCKVIPPVGSCQQVFISDTVSIRWYEWTKPVIQTDGPDLIAINSMAGANFKWWNKDQDTISYPPVNSGAVNHYTPPTTGYYVVETTLGSCYSLSGPIHYVMAADREIPVIRPNPVNDILVIDRIKLTDNWATLEILDSHGNLQLPVIIVTGKSTVTVNSFKLRNGIYFAILKTIDNKNLAIKFVKMD